jgi:hypothetical protein
MFGFLKAENYNFWNGIVCYGYPNAEIVYP